MTTVPFSLSYEGDIAEQGLVNFYDASRALLGFERSLAITTHAVLNGKVIVQAPALKGAEILIRAPQRGSWVAEAIIVVGGL